MTITAGPASAPAPVPVAAARRSADPKLRLLAFGLDTLDAVVPSAIGLAWAADQGPAIRSIVARVSAPFDDRLSVALLALERVDPVARARRGPQVLTVAELGGQEQFQRSLYGRRLLRAGLGAPTMLFLRADAGVVGGLAIVPAIDAPELTRRERDLLWRSQALLEVAFLLASPSSTRHEQRARLAACGLTDREVQIARLAASGATNSEIARAFVVAPATVKTHLNHAYAKLGVRSRTELAILLAEPAGASTS